MKPLNEIRTVKARSEVGLFGLPGVTGVDVGRKIVKGKKTDELSIRVYVQKKRKGVPESERIPEEIDGIKTDVIEKTFVLHTERMAVAELRPQADTATYDPLVGGISIGPCAAVGGYIYTGTLGCLVKDRETGELLMMSNYHVMAEKWPAGENMCQPSRPDGGSCPASVVGSLVRSVISENVDGAVARITARGHQCAIHEIGDVRGKRTATVGMKVRKRGRTTGLTHGVVESIDASVRVPYDDGEHLLRNQIFIEPDTAISAAFGKSGDSGSVVVDEDNRVVGLYFAGSDDGTLGVANPIDAALNELNVDLCTGKLLNFEKPPHLEKILNPEKPWYREVKDFFKERAYEKPPALEAIDWSWLWRVLPPYELPTGPVAGGPLAPGTQAYALAAGAGAGGPCGGSSLEARIQRLEALAAAQPAGGVSPAGLRCIEFATMPAGLGPNPRNIGGVWFQTFEFNGAVSPNTRIDTWAGQTGFNARNRTVIRHGPCPRVEITLMRFALSPTVTAFNAAGVVVAAATMTAGEHTDERITLAGAGIVRVEVRAHENEVLIRRYCHCGALKPPFFEKPPHSDKIPKIEHKEKWEIKEIKEKEIAKEKPELKELKEKELAKEKGEQKDIKEVAKELGKELNKEAAKEKPEPKELAESGFDPKAMQESGGPVTGMPPIDPGTSALEERVRRLEAALGCAHFIDPQLRPDLAYGALMHEPDYPGGR